MNFLRRILGLSADSNASAQEDDITITQSSPDAEVLSPPEPVIDTPTPAQVLSDEDADELAHSSEFATKEIPREVIDAGGTRPLPPLETFVPKPGQRLILGQLSDAGMVRSNNQDAVLSLISSSTSNDDMPDFGLFIVADGMGGHHDGEKASAIAARIVAQFVLDDILRAILSQQMHDPERSSIVDVLRAAVEKANDIVTDEIPEGGTTATTVVIMGDLAHIAHVGDSRAYLIANDSIEQVTRDHSLVQRLIELDQLTPEEAAEHPQRNVLYRAIGQSDKLEVDTITRRLPPRSRFLLCSDGLWNLVSEDTIVEIVHQHSNPQEACNQLVRLANERGGPDNITVILVQVPG